MRLILLCFFLPSIVFSQVGIGTTTPAASAKLEVRSTTQGFLPPRMTTTERNAIATPVAGLMIFNTTTGFVNIFNGTSWTELFPANVSGTISSLNIGGATSSGTLTSGTVASGISISVPYSGGNGEPHNGQTVTSTGVTGLTATLSAGTFVNGAGTLTYTISGTPTSSGTASFALNIGGQTGTLTTTVQFSSCGSNVTFTYRNASVTYGTVSKYYSSNSTTKCWLDRNLGASQVANSITDTDSYGDFFQWGRGDDGHQIKTSPITTDLSATDQPVHGQYIITYSSPYDWRTSQNNNLWQGVSGTNNPCPSGWRLPTAAELETERQSWSSNNSTGAFNSVLKLPTAGERSSSGGYSNAGTNTFLYSSDIGSGTGEGIYTKRLSFSSTGAAIGISNRANGGSVRCIKN
jgi:hypothetical protein